MIGPQDQWEVELQKASKAGLIATVKLLVRITGYTDRQELLEQARWARGIGRQIDLTRRIDRFLADPTGNTRRAMRKSAAAKKAARRRKKERKAK